jgi:phosphoribosyl-AMP cyclohydrolase
MSAVDEGPRPSVLTYDANGLVPAVIQDVDSGTVLMTAFMNAEALAATRATGRTHFWSRSRNRLWRKGETSGHEQLVNEIYVNCETNSVLIQVRQIGATCHDGYPTCYYRRLEPDDSLTVVRERAFDPDAVYGAADDEKAPSPPPRPNAGDREPDADDLEPATRRLFGAYRWLAEHDLTDVSSTSARLRAVTDEVSDRVADELRELAGALDGSHRHREPQSDVLLEGTQVLYWVVLAAVRAGSGWDAVRPDRALVTGDDELSVAITGQLLRAEAEAWAGVGTHSGPLAARCHATLALVGQACRVGGVSVRSLVEADLEALRSKPYLSDYFVSLGADSDAPSKRAG